ncbi:MAG: hypothetical protein KGZ25_15685 [Planctomycetes bacterium]|nr:hypothetical protein [Planctomycetota bacterium]
MEGQEFELQNASQTMSFLVEDEGVRVSFVGRSGDRITGRLAVRHLFYVDERNNMDPYGLDDRLTYETEHEREPLVFLGNGARIEVMHDGEGDTQLLALREEVDSWIATLTFEAEEWDPYFSADLRLTNSGSDTGRLMVVRLGFENLRVRGETAPEWTSAPESYKNRCFTRGRVEDIAEEDLRIATAPCGIFQPVMFVGDTEENGCALEFSPWLENYGAIILSNEADLEYTTFVDRYLEPGQEHHAGVALLKVQTDGWRRGLSEFKNTVPARFGHEVSPNIPEWAKELRPVTFPKRVAPIGDDLWKDYFEWAHEMGFNATMGFGWMWKRYQDVICAIAPENETLALDSEHGATEKSVRRHNEMLHELGMKSIVWTPTTGASSYAPICEEHPEWFVRDEDGDLRSSWRDENGDPWLVDSNPFSEGYHRYWRDLIFQIADWGFDGVFLDGVIARPSDAFSRPYPGRVHDGMYSAIRRLRRELDEAGLQDFLIKPESGDVMLADSVYWMNMPRLNLEQPLAPSRQMDPRLRDTPRYFLDDDCPTIEKSQITEHLELIARTWPEGMPGNWGVGYRSAGELTEYDFAKLALRCTFGSVVGIGLLKAREDPNFEHFAPETNGELPAAKVELNRKFFKRLKELNVLRAKHPALSRGHRDFDTIRSDNGAVPAFVRSDGNEDFLIVANLSGETLEITLQLMKEEPEPPFSEQEIQVSNPLSGAEQTFKKDSLLEGMSLELEENEVKIWQVTASGQKR